MKISLETTSGMTSVVYGVDGYCPMCGAPVRMHMAEKDQCWNGHIYPAEDTKPLEAKVFKVGDKVTVKEKRQGYPRAGVVTQEENEDGLIGVQIVGAVPNSIGEYSHLYPADRLEKV